VRSRGNSKQDIFLGDGDRWSFLRTLWLVVREQSTICHGYCLMTNHYHLLVETPEGNLSAGMKILNGVYSQTFNRKHDRTGHLFESRYRSRLIEEDGDLLQLCRYIVLNPVRAGIAIHPTEWRWSSYRAMCGSERSLEFLSTGFILAQFADGPADATDSFREFVEDGLPGSVSDDCIPSCARFDGEPAPMQRPPLFSLIKTGASRQERRQRARSAFLDHGYSTGDIAEHLGVSRCTVNRWVQRLREVGEE